MKNIEIILRNEVKYLGHKINAEGLTEQIIEDNLEKWNPNYIKLDSLQGLQE